MNPIPVLSVACNSHYSASDEDIGSGCSPVCAPEPAANYSDNSSKYSPLTPQITLPYFPGLCQCLLSERQHYGAEKGV